MDWLTALQVPRGPEPPVPWELAPGPSVLPGAPWSFGTDDLDALVRDAGLTVVDNVKMTELFRTFWPNRQLDSKFYDNYALCTLAAPHLQ
jgi:hypothetical protein